MTFWIIIAATLAAVSFALLEWRRANRHHLALRLAATVFAVAALALLGLRPAWRRSPPPAGGVRAVLWTPLASPAALALPAGIDAQHRFALPDAAHLDPAAKPIPDAAFLRRHHPEIGTVQLLGDGLDPSELAALRGLRVEFGSPNPPPGPPGIRFLRCPRELNLGDPLVVQGSLGPGTNATLTLEAPDGTTVNAATAPADATGETRFTLQTASPSATGRFLWHLRAPASAGSPAIDLPLGVTVVPPTLPRVLVLESAPRFDTAALRRWFEAAGGTLTARTQLGQDRYHYASSAASPPTAVHDTRRPFPRRFRSSAHRRPFAPRSAGPRTRRPSHCRRERPRRAAPARRRAPPCRSESSFPLETLPVSFRCPRQRPACAIAMDGSDRPHGSSHPHRPL